MTQSSRDIWHENAQKALRGADINSLTQQTADGLTRGPLSDASDRPEDFAALPRSAQPLLDGRPWHICAPVRDPDLKFANGQLLRDLKGGASAARISVGENALTLSANDLPRLLEGVHKDLIPITLAPHDDAALFDVFEPLSRMHVNLGLSPRMTGLDALAQKAPKTWSLVTVNAASISEAGGTAAQELAYLAAGIAKSYRVLGAQHGAKHIGAELTTDQDGHMNIAKMRAARRIHARISEAFGAKNAALTLHAISQKRMMQSIDPWTNMLRVMSAGFGAVTGGADYITLRPFTDAIGHADEFGYRIARNMQLLMMEESHLGHVSDPAYGSYFHERMTDKLAQAAWVEFQRIEGEGGFDDLSAFHARIAAGKAERAEHGEPILGVTLHPAENVRKAKVRGTV